jgi:ESF2/ABP1 family protein
MQNSIASPSALQDDEHPSEPAQETNDEMSEDEDEYEEGLVDGMDRSGFIGDRSLKPLTPEALATFKAAQDRAGVIYISRIPPGMQPAKVRHLMSAYGQVGRVYLQQEGMEFTMRLDA